MSLLYNFATWQFYVKYYFQIAYCFMLLESRLANKGSTFYKEKKAEFLVFARNYYDEHGMIYEEGHVNILLHENIDKELGAVLTELYYQYKNDQCLKDFIEHTLKIIETAEKT